MEKTLSVFNIIAIGILIYQINLYVRVLKIAKTDLRVVVYGVCLLNATYIFVHYGIIPTDKRYYLFLLIEVFRFAILFLICYYYTSKASELINNHKIVIRYLKIFGVLSSIIVLSLYIHSTESIVSRMADPSKKQYDLCT